MEYRFLQNLLLTFSLLLPASTFAYSITANFDAVAAGGNVLSDIDGVRGRVSGGQMRFKNVTTDLPAQIGLGTLYGWCIEPTEYVNRKSTTWEIVDLADGNNSASGLGTQRANYLRELFHFVMPDFSQLTDRTTGLALQIATWEIVSDNALGKFDLGSGNAIFSNANPASAVSLAQGWLNTVINDGEQDAMLDNLYAMTRDGKQDQIVQFNLPREVPSERIPVPATFLLLLVGLGLLAGRRLRR